MHVILLFIDGFGLGSSNPEDNPLIRYKPRFFSEILGTDLCQDAGKIILPEICLISTDANLGVDGLPQSATGQTAIFTGVNASQRMGRHIAGFPGPSLAALIREHGIMKRLMQKGFHVASANMYTHNYMELVEKKKRRHSATTLLILDAGLPLRTAADMHLDMAIYQDITNEMLPILGVTDIAPISARLAAKRLINLSRQYEFTLFEYFQTDRCGHKQNWTLAAEILHTLNEFLYTIYRHTPTDTLVIVTSDHGNFEDFSKKTHTRNPVPTLLWGRDSEKAAASINALTDITPAILAAIEGGKVHG